MDTAIITARMATTTSNSTSVNAMLPFGNRKRPARAQPKGGCDEDDWGGLAQVSADAGGAGRARRGRAPGHTADQVPQPDSRVVCVIRHRLPGRGGEWRR